MLEDSSPGLSCVSACLLSRGTVCLCSRVSFQEYLYSKHFWKMETMSFSRVKVIYAQYNKDNIFLQGKGQERLTAHYKISEFPKPAKGYVVSEAITWPSSHCTVGSGAQENDTNVLAAVTDVSNKVLPL